MSVKGTKRYEPPRITGLDSAFEQAAGATCTPNGFKANLGTCTPDGFKATGISCETGFQATNAHCIGGFKANLGCSAGNRPF